ncbi:unnamed protein product [Prorocentrum cordatum]|uniref:Uncharacterized protein n=1 Tax=Prorocentrum cordatum TaxID=2364126 RepID=A0ABN9SEG8_9DINO|nr:unnamed protein product [Polarella glacialis]
MPPAPVQVQAPQQAGPAGGSGNGDKKAAAAAILSDLNGMVGRQQPAAIQAYVDQKFKGTPAEQHGIRSVLGNLCRHYILNSRQVVKHSRAQCRAEGGKPSSPCSRCGARGIMAYCWPEDCPNARSPPSSFPVFASPLPPLPAQSPARHQCVHFDTSQCDSPPL